MATTAALSILAAFDDLRRCTDVLVDGTAEEEFLRFLKLQEKYRRELLNTAQEAQRIQKELDASLQSMADLETKLFHARRLLETETKARRAAEHDRDQMEKKILAVADLLQHERNLKDETKDKLAFLNTLPRKRKSLNRHVEDKYGEINNTNSFLSDLSITQSEDDFLDVHTSRSWKKHRPSVPKNSIPCIGSKKSRLSGGLGSVQNTPNPPIVARRSGARRTSMGVNVNQHTLQVTPGLDQFCATTKVTIPQDGTPIRAESTIETVPPTTLQEKAGMITNVLMNNGTPKRSSGLRETTAPLPMTPSTPAANKFGSSAIANIMNGSPAMTNRPTFFRQHNFSTKSFIRPEACVQCQKKIRFGAIGLRCRDCPVCCHVDCRHLLKVSCVPQTSTPVNKGLMGYIADYVPSKDPLIPALIVHCVNEIECRGLQEVGLYRVPGSERDVKSLKERFLRGKSTPNLSKIDVHVLCGCIKDFLRSLREPLIPTNLWKDFCNAAQNPNDEEAQRELCKAIDKLPQANRDTLAFLILHFQKIAECPEILMPIDNIARILGPTIVGNSTPDPDQHSIYTEVYAQTAVMTTLLKIPTNYWTNFVGFDDKENELLMTPATIMKTPVASKDTPYSIYATPLKTTLKKRRFYDTPSHK